jgi:hypothetical protein
LGIRRPRIILTGTIAASLGSVGACGLTPSELSALGGVGLASVGGLVLDESAPALVALLSVEAPAAGGTFSTDCSVEASELPVVSLDEADGAG